MASDGNPGTILKAGLVQGSHIAVAAIPQQTSGKSAPTGGKNVAQSASAGIVSATGGSPAAVNASSPAATTVTARTSDPQALVDLLNRYLNDSGRPDQFRVDPSSGGKLIQEINPATGEVIGEFSVSEFPALARSVGATGLLVDSRA